MTCNAAPHITKDGLVASLQCQRFATQSVGNGEGESAEDGWQDVVDLDAVHPLPAARLLEVAPDEEAVLRMVGVIRAGVIFEGKVTAAAGGADRAPTQIAEVDDKIRRDATHGAVDLARQKDPVA